MHRAVPTTKSYLAQYQVTWQEKPESKAVTIQYMPWRLVFDSMLSSTKHTAHWHVCVCDICVTHICVWHVYDIYTSWLHSALRRRLKSLTLDIFLNFHSTWLRAGHRTWHWVFLHAWSKVLHHNNWAIYFQWTTPHCYRIKQTKYLIILPNSSWALTSWNTISGAGWGKKRSLTTQASKFLGSIVIRKWFWQLKKTLYTRESHKNNKIWQKQLN